MLLQHNTIATCRTGHSLLPIVLIIIPDITDEEEKLRGKAFLLLMCQMGKSGMYHRVQCETAWGFPDVTLREEKPCARVYSLLM